MRLFQPPSHCTPMPTPLCTIDAVCRFIDITITGVAGEDIDVCLKLEDATGEIERPVNLSISTLNGTAIRMFVMIICFKSIHIY